MVTQRPHSAIATIEFLPPRKMKSAPVVADRNDSGKSPVSSIGERSLLFRTADR
jgi:hypothetical protein